MNWLGLVSNELQTASFEITLENRHWWQIENWFHWKLPMQKTARTFQWNMDCMQATHLIETLLSSMADFLYMIADCWLLSRMKSSPSSPVKLNNRYFPYALYLPTEYRIVPTTKRRRENITMTTSSSINSNNKSLCEMDAYTKWE